MAKRYNLDNQEIKALTLCLIGGGGFIGSHLCNTLMKETSHSAIVIDVHSEKINHLLHKSCSWHDRIQFHTPEDVSIYATSINGSDIIIDLISICDQAMPMNTKARCFFETTPAIIKCCVQYKKRLIHFSSSEVYGKTIGSFLPENDPLRQDPNFYVLKEDASPCIFGPIEEEIWSYACSKQLMERFICALYTENDLEFTIVRPFNWIGPGMDFAPGIDGVSRVIACFAHNLADQEPLKLVDGGKSMRSFCYINDAIEAVLLMIDNPERANGRIFNVGNPNNEVTIKRVAEMMIEVFTNKFGVESTTMDVTSEEFDGAGGYEDCDRRIPSMELIKAQLDWTPRTPLQDALEVSMMYYLNK